ncbi:Eco57I restriction-modification methylase domain-containing protein [Carnobacterium maltaromaticum]|uniref:Eco57I restriction-modification methylase domain-containing protein n=1 Tax=Carnobacterium maltaromaticum TaxID=2751 RepID=UPI0039B0C73A
MDKDSIIKKIEILRDDFYLMMKDNKSNVSEEKIRSGYLNKLLELFGWNLSNTMEVIEEKTLQGRAKEKLNEIKSIHKKPDYQLLDRGVLRMYLDAKNATENFEISKSIAFQIRSYGWSSELDISIVSNFGVFGVYDTTFKPDNEMESNYRAFFFSIDDLINEFELYSQFFIKNIVQNNAWDLAKFINDFHKGDSRSLDNEFLILINNFRVKLGNEIYKLPNHMTENALNYYVQVIINRILFIRVLEDLGFEPYKSLYKFFNSKSSFWSQFQEKTKKDFWNRYDGALFTEKIPEMDISNDSFSEFISSLYTNSPYRFNVIKPSLIAEIYDIFLGEKLVINGRKLCIKKKPLSPIGSVPTPSEISDYVCKNAIGLDNVTTIKELLALRIIDPCVGSGTFLVSAYNLLSFKYKEILNKEILHYSDLKSIVTNCLYGVDIDELALEVLKMTISLQLVTSNFIIQEPIEKLLSDFSKNFRLGNTIVQKNATELGKEEDFQLPTDYCDLFPEIMKEGGFSHLVANPPYIEPKHFKAHWPNTLLYLKKMYVSSKGKADISLFFIERFFSLVRVGGEVGLITQNRFFKTEYGIPLQKWFGENQYLKKITEFKSNRLFKGKITYVTCLFGSKLTHSTLSYSYLTEEVNSNRTNLFSILNEKIEEEQFSSSTLSSGYWSRNFFIAETIINRILAENKRRFMTFNDSEEYDIIVGPQVLDSKFFILKDVTFDSNGIITSQNRRGDKVVIEKEIIRKVLRNNHMESFENLNNKREFSYIVFPYDKDAKLIDKLVLENEYPLAYAYLKDMQTKSDTKKRSNPSEFYRYTREQNHDSYFRPKIFFPMTIRELLQLTVMKVSLETIPTSMHLL